MKVKLREAGTPTQHEVELGDDLTLYFSYQTCVGFWLSGHGRVVSENVWSNTTAKHLNTWEPDKTRRVKHDEFEKQLEAVLARISLKTEEN
jgi:hypothetical protein